eukprot:jgi/Psemu1/318045/estExt_fgenesh1_pm.C_420008
MSEVDLFSSRLRRVAVSRRVLLRSERKRHQNRTIPASAAPLNERNIYPAEPLAKYIRGRERSSIFEDTVQTTEIFRTTHARALLVISAVIPSYVSPKPSSISRSEPTLTFLSSRFYSIRFATSLFLSSFRSDSFPRRYNIVICKNG